ncbi:MAG: hypothetical protein Q8R58_00295 [Sulfuricurvum sp.]|nr:hypothetical protein [Sulfuricurvum sp.]
MKLLFHPYLRYKFFNSLFTGAVGGSVFTVYGSLNPSTFSIGGILLALGLMGMAYFYHYFMKLEHFFRFSLAAEVIMLVMIIYFLAFPAQILTALIVYGAYQLSFMFGGYLVRAETHFAKHARIMGWIDVVKQQGYLAGLLLSYGFYKSLEFYGITQAMTQVYWLHLFLLPLEIVIIVLLRRGFKSQ